MEVVGPHAGLEVASPRSQHQQQYADSSPEPTYYSQYPKPQTSPTYFSPPAAAHAPSHTPPSHAPTETWTAAPSQKPTRSWLLPAAIAAAIAAIVVGGAVGGGLGATLSSCRGDLRSANTELSAMQAYGCSVADSASPTSSSTPTACVVTAGQATTTDGLLKEYEVAPPTSIQDLRTDCADLASQDQNSNQNERFSVKCGLDFAWGKKAGEGGSEVYIADTVGMVVYNFESCINACSSYNQMAGRSHNGLACDAVTFRWDMKNTYSANKANCWLKNTTIPTSSANKCGSACLTAVRLK